VRPFEIGDMVCVRIGDHKPFIEEVKSCSHEFLITTTSGGIIHHDYVKHIRKPRKGGKESRDIVAMIGREHHKYLLSMLKIWVTLDDEIEAVSNRKADYWRIRKRGGFNRQSMSFMLFQKTKEKLGASNE